MGLTAAPVAMKAGRRAGRSCRHAVNRPASFASRLPVGFGKGPRGVAGKTLFAGVEDLGLGHVRTRVGDEPTSGGQPFEHRKLLSLPVG